MRIALIQAVLALTPLVCAQDYLRNVHVVETREGHSRIEAPVFGVEAYFRTHFTPSFPDFDMKAPSRLSDFVVDGHLELSLQGYLELVLANNPDYAIQKLSVEAPRNAMTRALARFDPTATASFRGTRNVTPTSSELEGAQTLSQLTQPLNFTFGQTLDTGARYDVGFSGNKRSTNSQFATVNPSINASLDVSVSQPLIRNFGRRVNRLQYYIAQTRFEQSRYDLEDQLLFLLAQAENVYWAAIEARENLRVAQENVRLNETLLKRAERELELGAISALDIYQPQQNLENARIGLIQAEYRLEQTLDGLRRQIGADLVPDYQHMPVVLTQQVLPSPEEEPSDPEQMVETAYRLRPDLKSTIQNLDVDQLRYEIASNQLKPDLSLSANYSSKGLGGNLTEFDNGRPVGIIPGGIGDALNQLFSYNFPTYGVALTLRLPIRDRSAVADLADAAVSKKTNTLRIQSLQQDIRLDVLNAVSQLESSRARVRLAQTALDFSQKRLDAEQKKYDLGVTTIFFLIQAQNDLVAAQSAVVTQAAQYRRNLTQLLRVTATLLEERHVVVAID